MFQNVICGLTALFLIPLSHVSNQALRQTKISSPDYCPSVHGGHKRGTGMGISEC
jgi:hypothetical protein